MKTVVIAGASGVVGSRALHHLLGREDVGRVVALGRRPLALQHPKLVSTVVDLRSAAAVAPEIPDGVDVAVCCLGTTMKQAGSREAFRAVDHDAVVAFGEAARSRGARRFLVVSALGASARSRSFYLRTKGEAEEALARLGYPEVTVLRPSFIDDEGARRDARLGERVALPIARAVFSVLGRTSRYAPASADVVARALVRLAFDGGAAGVRVVESDALHRLAA
jgi:uncharacterized protein YbjT (DUF2867 family)